MQTKIAVTSPFSDNHNSFFIVKKLIEKCLHGKYETTSSIEDCSLQIHVGAPDESQRGFFAHKKRPVLFFTFVESLDIPRNWVEILNDVEGVLVASHFCKNVLRCCGVKSPIWLIPLGLDLDSEPELCPDIRDSTFTVMWQGVHQQTRGLNGTALDGDRKRGYLVEQAFRRAEIPNSRLILKYFANSCAERDDREGSIWRIEKSLAVEEIRELDRIADFFAFPTRGEGFGLLPLEKLSRGVPVCVTGWSGPLDYLTDFEGSQITTFDLTEVVYHNIRTKMADVSLNTLVEWLRWAHANLHELRGRRTKLANIARSRWDFRVKMVVPLLQCLSSSGVMRYVVPSPLAVAVQARDEHSISQNLHASDLNVDDDGFDAYLRVGDAQLELGLHTEALANFNRALSVRPDSAETLLKRGFALLKLERFREALWTCDKVLALRADSAEAHNSRGVALHALKRFEDALASYDRALTRSPDRADALNNRGVTLAELHCFDEAVASYDRVLALCPSRSDVFRNRALALQELKRFDEALASSERATSLAPDCADAAFTRATLLLQAGNFSDGWRGYEARRNTSQWAPRDFAASEWEGEDPDGKKILLYCEQGLGDMIQFARFARAVAARGATVVMQTPPALCALLQSLGDVTISCGGDHTPAFDLHLPLMSVPHVLGITEKDLAPAEPYLAADPKRVEAWAKRLPKGALRIGLAWQESRGHAIDLGRSIPLRCFEPLSRIAGVSLISLQKNDGLTQLHDVPPGMKVETLGEDFDSGLDAFLDCAAVMMNLDLIVTSDTAIAHLAGALGRPVWVLLKYVADWRWLVDRDDSPWYPSARLFRQTRRGDWSGLVAHVAAEAARIMKDKAGLPDERTPGGTALVPISFGELVDKVCILEIKSERMDAPAKAAHVRAELAILRVALARFLDLGPRAAALRRELREINETLWDAEDRLRICESNHDFGTEFVATARTVYTSNDRRTLLKRQLNELAGSTLIEEKSYVERRVGKSVRTVPDKPTG